MKDYRQYLRSVGIKPLKGRLRTEKEPGSVEIAYDPRTGDWEKFTHEGEVSNVVPLRKRRVA